MAFSCVEKPNFEKVLVFTILRHFTVFDDVTHHDEVLSEGVSIVFIYDFLFASWVHNWGYEAGDRCQLIDLIFVGKAI